MKDSIHKYFQVGTLLWMSYPEGNELENFKKLAEDIFFDLIEVAGLETAEKTVSLRCIAEQAGVSLGYGAHPMILSRKLNANAVDDQERREAEKLLLRAVDEAALMGCKRFTFLAGQWDEKTKERNYSQLIKTTQNICKYAEEKEIFVQIEVFDYDVDKAVLIGPAQLAAQFAADVKATSDNFGLLIDLSHIPIAHETPEYVIKTCGPYITHFHIGNAVMKPGCTAYGDKHPRFGYPDSENDEDVLIDFLSILREHGFFSADHPYPLSFEIKPQPDEDANAILANSKRTLQRAWARLPEE